MKNIKYIGISLIMMFAITACNDFLDVNINPNSTSDLSATISSRLPWIQHHYLKGQFWAGEHACFITQQTTSTFSSTEPSIGWRTGHGWLAGWKPYPASVNLNTMAYQYFFIGAGGNFNTTYAKAEAEGAYHYMGAIKAIRAAGFMLMTDLHGEMPYHEAFSAKANPKLDDGQTIFMGCLAEIDEAIALFQRVQATGATPLRNGDIWNGGDANKWIKMCYGLKARWLNNLSKKTSLYDSEAILQCLTNAPQSNNDNTIEQHEDVAGDATDHIWNDPFRTSILYDGLAGDAQERIRVTKWYADLLSNFDNQGIEDPRANKLIPCAQFGGENKYWKRSEGVDMQSDIRLNSGPAETKYDNATKQWTVTGSRLQDTVYVSFHAKSAARDGASDDTHKASDGTVLSSGTFYTRPTSPSHFLCYHEMCFIKAEVLFKKNDKPGAFAAYKEGVKAHIDLMNSKLQEYGLSENPSKSIMEQSGINNFLNNAIGTADNLTIGKIMTQKFIAMSFSLQNWNDMRRHDYSTTAYPGWAIPYEYFSNTTSQRAIPLGSQFRRFVQPVRETMYNQENVAASHPHALLDDIYSFPVWWDTAE
ncbi:MAG: SusD/RagB family nutrient-binding outer membrane lipoprotein [Prevotellaceae bacterium]|jgi:hypothetical protein|nr:SusD/RagB family nutrient-binding outer membrane lipoprotein [Prevotellaceae bacterium]